MISAIIYQGESYSYKNFSHQLKTNIVKLSENLINLGIIERKYIQVIKKLLEVDLKLIIIPEQVQLINGTLLSIKKLFGN